MDFDYSAQLNDLARLAPEPPKPAPKWNGWSDLKGIIKAIPSIIAEPIAGIGESTKAFGQALDSTGTAGAGGMFSTQTEAEARQSEATRKQISAIGMTGRSAASTRVRDFAEQYAPDPITASKAEQVIFGLTKGVGKAIGYGLTTGPAAPLLFGLDEGLTQMDQLQRQGVDTKTAAKAGMVAGAVNTAGFAIPVAGKTIAQTIGLATLSGPASFIAQQASTREILRAADYKGIAESFDPLDPTGLALSMLPFGFGAWAARSHFKAGKARDAAQPAGTTERRPADARRSNGSEQLPINEPGLVPADARAADAQGVAGNALAGDGPRRLPDAVAAQEHVDAAMVHNLTMAADAEIHGAVRPMESLADFAARTLPEDVSAVKDGPDPFLAWIKQNGGVSFADKFDITGEASGVRLNRGGVFMKSGKGLDDLAVIAEAEGWIPPGSTKDIDGGVPQLRDMLKRSMEGERITRLEDQYTELAQRQYASEQEQRAAHLENRLRMLGVDPAPARGNADVMQAYLDQHEPRLLSHALTDIAAENVTPPEVMTPAWVKQRDDVAAVFRQQLDAAGRFEPEVNKQYADMLGSFYATQAGRTGMTAKALAAKYPLRIQADLPARAGPTLNQVDLPKTIEIDGQQRSTTNSAGQPIAATEEGGRNFWKWFGASRVVDGDGRPLVVYHGTRNEFTTFDYSKIGDNGRAEGAGFYFTNSEKVASGYGEPLRVFLSIKKPLAYDAKGFSKAVVQKIVRRVAEREAEAEGGDIADGFLSNFGDVRSEGLNSVVRQAADLIADDPTAVDQLSGIVGSGVNAEHVNRATYDVTGHDGVVANGFSNSGDADNRIFVAFFPEQIKSADRNRGTFGPNSPNILEQFAGVNAKTNNVNELTNARRRLAMGDDAEAVRKETGWHKGVDGRWRFEISDADAKLRPALESLKTGGFTEKEIASVTYRKVGDLYELTLNPVNPQSTNDFVVLRGVSREVLDSVVPEGVRNGIDRGDGEADFIGNTFEDAKRIDASFRFEGFNALPLSQAIDHPKLFAAYPRLADVMVQVDPRLGRGGSFVHMNNGQQVIRIGRSEQLQTMLHEIQHGIQDIEGFASGGSPMFGSPVLEDAAAALKAKLRVANAESGFYAAAQNEASRTGKPLGELVTNQAWFYEGAGKDTPGAAVFRDYLAAKKAAAESAADQYQRLAGEVEARNTQARAAMTDAERAATDPAKTADVAVKDVIVTFNGKEMANAPTPENIDMPAPRGQISLGANISELPSVITIFDGADRSTVLHESGHFFIEVQADLARQISERVKAGEAVSAGERGVADDMAKLLDWAGIKDKPDASALDQWLGMTLDSRRGVHEQFARAFETYAMEGKAPSAELAGIFQRFKDWLRSIYEDAKKLNVQMTDEVRGVFDRMLATDQQIAAKAGEPINDVPTTQELGAQARQAAGPQATPQGGGGPEEKLVQSVRGRADAVVTEAPDLVVGLDESGAPITASEMLDKIRRDALEGSDDELGGQDAPLLEVAALCALSHGS